MKYIESVNSNKFPDKFSKLRGFKIKNFKFDKGLFLNVDSCINF